MSDHTPILCPHGRATSWTGYAAFGDRLPECEHCAECNPDAVELVDAGEIGLIELLIVLVAVGVLAVCAGWLPR